MDRVDGEGIESIEIIKGDAARALYGNRAGGGVISITTKSAAGIDTEPPPPPLTAIREPAPDPSDVAVPELTDVPAEVRAETPAEVPTPEPMDAATPEPADAATLAPPRVEVEGDHPALIAEPPGPSDPDRSSRLLEPLVVIDGVIQDDFTVLRDMDPDEIDSIEVLKGSVAAGLYGSRASHGVIVVKTKKPQP
jgi:TonB-dependent SusC/RagA subfamily outer membrane receptor